MLEADKRRIEIQDINQSSLKTIIEFAYTAKAIITIDNVQNLLFASTVLQTEDLAEACSSFLRQHLSLSNCTEIRQYAELLNRKSLIDLADEFIRDHFLDIVQIDDFYKISYKHLKVNSSTPHGWQEGFFFSIVGTDCLVGFGYPRRERCVRCRDQMGQTRSKRTSCSSGRYEKPNSMLDRWISRSL